MSNQVESFKVLTTLAAYRVVSCVSSTANTVQYPEAAQNPFLGVSIDTVLDTNASVAVAISGRAKLYFNAAVVAGQLVGSDTSGRGVAFTLPNTTTSLSLAGQYIGVLIGPTIATTATIAEILVNPGFVRVSS